MFTLSDFDGKIPPKNGNEYRDIKKIKEQLQHQQSQFNFSLFLSCWLLMALMVVIVVIVAVLTYTATRRPSLLDCFQPTRAREYE